MNGAEEFKLALKGFIDDNTSGSTYIAKVISTNPLKLKNNYFEIEKSQIYILNLVNKYYFGSITTDISDKHSHTINDKLKIGDEVLIKLYEQDMNQKFIIIDKVVKYE